MIYLDSSALLKLVHQEAESAALAEWLTAQVGVPVVSSELAAVEVVRASRRLNPTTVAAARSLMAGVDIIPLTGAVVDVAADVGDASLRSLDAIHLASALSIRDDLTAVVAYDTRLIAAMRDAGLACLHPGV